MKYTSEINNCKYEFLVAQPFKYLARTFMMGICARRVIINVFTNCVFYDLQECYSELYITTIGSIRYNLGCKDISVSG